MQTQLHIQNNRKKRFGDRKDGFRLRNLGVMANASIKFMKRRCDSQVLSCFELDITDTVSFIRKNHHEMKKLSLQMILYAALVRTYARYPRMNRFIVGSRCYGRDYVRINIIAKPKLDADSEEYLVPVYFDRSETLPQVIEKYSAAFEKIKYENQKQKEMEASRPSILKILLNNLTAMATKLGGVLVTLDRINLAPKAFLEISPFHGSAFVTNMGSLGIPAVYHHLYEIGTVSHFLALGQKEIRYIHDDDHNPQKRIFVTVKITVDERICDGYYLSRALKCFEKHIKDPTKLMVPPEKLEFDS